MTTEKMIIGKSTSPETGVACAGGDSISCGEEGCGEGADGEVTLSGDDSDVEVGSMMAGDVRDFSVAD